MSKPMIYYPNLFKNYYNSHFREIEKELQLSQMEVDILLFLYHNPEWNTARDICNLRGLAKSNVSNGIEALAGRGLLTVREDEQSRRIKRLYLTSKGETILETLVECQNTSLWGIVEGFSKEEIATLTALLARCNQNMENWLKLQGGKD